MAKIDDGKRILAEAEESLRTLAADAVSTGEYDTVVVLADWAKSLRGLVSSMEFSPADRESGVKGNGAPRENHQDTPSVHPRKGTGGAGYPRFYRDADSLIKVAWSKANKGEYEHKAPRSVIRDLASAIARAGKRNELILMDRVLPLTSADGDDIPSYQCYLCLAWLRDLGLVLQHGRKGYSVKTGCRLESEVAAAWEVLPQRTAV